MISVIIKLYNTRKSEDYSHIDISGEVRRCVIITFCLEADQRTRI